MVAKKATKKFNKNHLKHTLEQRKTVQAFKKKISKGHKKPKHRADEESYVGKDASEKKATRKSSEPALGDKNASELFATGIEDDVEDALKTASGSKKSRAAVEDDAGDFTQFLDQEDQDLLQDGDDSEDDDGQEPEDEELLAGEDSDDETEKPAKKSKKAAAAAADDDDDSQELTRADVARWRKALDEEYSLRALKRVAIAFRAAVHVGQDDNSAQKFKYTITDPQVYNDVIMLTLTRLPNVLQHHIPITESPAGRKSAGRKSVPLNSKKYQQLSPILKSLSGNLLVLMSGLTDSKTMAAVLTAGDQLLPYFVGFKKFVKEFIKAVVDIWSTATDEGTRLMAWAVIRSAAESDKSMLELCLKTSYAGMVKNCRHTSVHTMPMILFMKNTAATLYSLDPETTYQTAFDFIRQLAIHLRNSVVHKTKDSYKSVYNWQYIHSLDFWRRVLSLQCDVDKEASDGKESHMRPLIYPLVQVMLGAMRLIPAAQYFPLRFMLFHSLLDLSRDTDVYIPLMPAITELLTSTTVTKSGKPSTLRPFDFEHNIRANTAYLGTRIYQTGVCEQIVECVAEFFGLHAKSIAFPELAVPCVLTLKRYARRRDRMSSLADKSGRKGGKSHQENYRFHKQLLEVVEKIEANSKYIEEKRKNVEFSPTSFEMVDAFLKDIEWESTPLGQYLTVQREVREEKMRILRESLKHEKEDGEGRGDNEEDVFEDEEDDEDIDDEAMPDAPDSD
ncbi:Noc2p family-domain-containing protein [Myxozyma melibiosi]|uniref:Noc2p family-domain-containing protein n=1 Tax=Myxozyma melibiosi TaxID=54550 RepID=A0ABR1F4Z4_9ASCO